MGINYAFGSSFDLVGRMVLEVRTLGTGSCIGKAFVAGMASVGRS